MKPERGQIVRLNDEGQEMQIDKITGNRARCSWLGEEDREFDDFPLDELVVVGKRPAFKPIRRR